ncbi:hypothetical protein [Nonomuraea wenchangensis]|uniref:hypothetical protein n=1 Tax=Nonomuraea wenchangensis TaxID=568860 RepID=UPI0033CD006C
MTDYRAEARNVQAAYVRKLEKARARYQAGETGARARDREVAAAYHQATHLLGELQKAEDAHRKTTQQQRLHTLFGLPKGSTGMDVVAFNDAQDRAARLTDVKEAERLLAKAQRNGNDVLARAIAEHSAEMGWRNITATYLESKPGAAETYTEWERTAREDNNPQARFHRAADYILPSPSEISALQPHQVEQLANSGDGSEAA